MFEGIIEGYRWFFLRLADVVGLGWGIVALSFITSVAMMPLMKAVAGVVRRETEYQSVILPQIADINNRYATDIERNLHIQRLYARYSYSPLSAVKKVLPLFVQIPFLLLTYFMLKGTAQLSDVPFLFLRNLGEPDALAHGFNILPFVMTGVNLVTVFATPGFTRRDQTQAIGIALLFLVMLYAAPSALLLYWTLNNTITMFRTMCTRRGEGALLFYRNIAVAFRWCWTSPLAVFLAVVFSLFCFQMAWSLQSCEGVKINLGFGMKGMMIFIVVALIVSFKVFRSCKATISLSIGLGYTLVWLSYTYLTRNSYSVVSWMPDWYQSYWIAFAFFAAPLVLEGWRSTMVASGNLLRVVKSCWAIALLPVVVALHYAFSSDGFTLPFTSILLLVLYLALPTVAAASALAILFRDKLDMTLSFRLSVGACVGVFLAPMIAAEAGTFGYLNNFLVRSAFIACVMALVWFMDHKRLSKPFVLLLFAAVIVEAFLHKEVQSEGAIDADRSCTASWVEELPCVRKPNIYLLVYDGYAHRMVLEKTGLAGGFVVDDYLANKGFTIYDAYSIGAGTVESMSSTFVIGGVSGQSDRSTLAGDNLLVSYLHRFGYRVSYVLCGYELPSRGEPMPADYYYPTPQKVAKPEKVLLTCILQGFLTQSARAFDSGTEEEWHSAKCGAMDSIGSSGGFMYAHTGYPGHNAWSPRYRKSDEEEQAAYKIRLDKANEAIRHDIEKLERSGKLEDAVVIVASDHGGFLLNPKEFGNPTPLEILDREGVILAIHWPKDYKPTLKLNCLQNVMLEVMIYLSGDPSLARFAINGTTHPMIRPMDTPAGFIKDGIIQIGPHRGKSIFKAAEEEIGMRDGK